MLRKELKEEEIDWTKDSIKELKNIRKLLFLLKIVIFNKNTHEKLMKQNENKILR